MEIPFIPSQLHRSNFTSVPVKFRQISQGGALSSLSERSYRLTSNNQIGNIPFFTISPRAH